MSFVRSDAININDGKNWHLGNAGVYWSRVSGATTNSLHVPTCNLTLDITLLYEHNAKLLLIAGLSHSMIIYETISTFQHVRSTPVTKEKHRKFPILLEKEAVLLGQLYKNRLQRTR